VSIVYPESVSIFLVIRINVVKISFQALTSSRLSNKESVGRKIMVILTEGINS
jgi:hypothetical protein